LLERSGVARRAIGPSDAEVQQAIRMYREGLSTATIGAELGLALKPFELDFANAALRCVVHTIASFFQSRIDILLSIRRTGGLPFVDELLARLSRLFG
jgi:hypothetical protein